jgi:Flp pilus assembly protein TadG
MIFSFPPIFSRLKSDERGTILVQFTIYLIAMMGLIGLALDGGRFILLNNSLQDLADAAALAGAAQLDSKPQAKQRATDAAQAIANENPPKPWYYDIAGSITVTTAFYSAISPSGDTPATGDADAHYIKVTTSQTQPWETAPWFVSAVSVFTKGAVLYNKTYATAMAKKSFLACGPVQAYMCASGIPSGTQPGWQFLLATGGSGGNGNWGILDLPPGVTDYTAYFAQTSLSSCTDVTSLHQSPGNGNNNGNIGSPADGINVWFDHPQDTSGDLSTAAPNVIDGVQACKIKQNTTVAPNYDDKKNEYGNDPNTGLPTYGCGTTGSCMLPRDPGLIDWKPVMTNQGPWYASGVRTTDLQAYWNNHHGTMTLPTGVNSDYTAYQCELGVGSFGAVSGCGSPLTWNTDTVESHGPHCSANTADYKRRIIHVGIVPDDACPNGNAGGNLTITGNSDFFITENAFMTSSGLGGQPVIYGEYINSYPVNGPGGIIRTIVQLVR